MRWASVTIDGWRSLISKATCTLSSELKSREREAFSCVENGSSNSKRKRRPADTSDPDAEAVSLSPKRCWNRIDTFTRSPIKDFSMIRTFRCTGEGTGSLGSC
ncbi:hypothetical protein AAC387_Pa11g0430 [Persea americana]